jgi:hypothetical protein
VLKPLRRWDWFEVSFEVGKTIGQVPGVRYQQGKFHVHRTHLPLLHGVQGIDVSSYLATPEQDKVTHAGDLTLRPWQSSALEWIRPRRGVVLGDEMRLGKTLTALLTHDPATGPLVIIAPLDTRAVWMRWIERLWPGIEVYCIEGKAIDTEKLYRAPVIFGHFDVLTYHQTTKLLPGTLLIDEAHLLSNPKSRRTNAVLFYASIAARVVVMTGTPLWNRTAGLWGLLAAANPGAWGKLFDFAQRYAQPEMTEYGWRYNGVSNREEWEARRTEVLIARSWGEVLPDLPPIQRETPLIELDTDQRYEVDLAAAGLMDGAAQLDVTVLAHYRQAVGRFKVGYTIERVRAYPAPIVVWVWHKEIAKQIVTALRAGGRECFVMTGADNAVKRARTIEAWNASSDAVMVATMAVGQVGIDLSHARCAIFTEIDWTPAVLSQTEMRVFHPDEERLIVYPQLAHEIDQKLLETILTKITRGQALGMAAVGSSFAEMAHDPEEDTAQVLRDLGAALLGLAA